MSSRWAVFLITIPVIVLSCATTPPVIQTFSPNADTLTEIAHTDEMLKEAQSRQIDVLSPENYTDAQLNLDKAKKMRDAGKPNSEALEKVALSRAWLKEAEQKAELSMTAMKEVFDARAGALRAGAHTLLEKNFKTADKELIDITSAVESGNMKPAEKKGTDITALYRDLEVQAVKKTHLNITEENIKSATKLGAKKKAPRSYALAEMKMQNVERMIQADPRNDVAIRRGAEDANRESVHLMDVITRVNAGNTEELVLTAERQQRTISNLRNEYASSEQELNTSKKELSEVEKEKQLAEKARQDLLRQQAELQKSENLLQKAAQVRSQFKPNEAEVYAENGKLKVRLKAIQFPSGTASLGAPQQQFLNKVETALAEIGPSKITVEGHTDATGKAITNQVLSEQRAQAVGEYFTSKGVLRNDRVQTIGKGASEPISENSSAKGRSENRRIDLIIETE